VSHPIADFARSLLPLVVAKLPDVAAALMGAADRGELDEATVDAVRGKLPAVGESEVALEAAKAAAR
jgi:hypothetical protein